MSETATVAKYVDAETHVVTASNGVDYAYRTAGDSDATPLVALQHFRGNLDNWDPALIDALARERRVITFDNRDATTSWQTRLAQYDAVCAWGQPNHSLLERVSAIDKPVFVANGDSDSDSDRMILPRYSYLLAGLIPGARLKIYPDAAHGFLFQHHAEFAADLDAFLGGA